MPDAARIAAAFSRRLRLAALTVIALFAVKIAAAALAGPSPAAARTAIDTTGVQHSAPETLERME